MADGDNIPVQLTPDELRQLERSRRKRAEAERNQQLIDAGSGTRASKNNALQNKVWLQGSAPGKRKKDVHGASEDEAREKPAKAAKSKSHTAKPEPVIKVVKAVKASSKAKQSSKSKPNKKSVKDDDSDDLGEPEQAFEPTAKGLTSRSEQSVLVKLEEPGDDTMDDSGDDSDSQSLESGEEDSDEGDSEDEVDEEEWDDEQALPVSEASYGGHSQGRPIPPELHYVPDADELFASDSHVIKDRKKSRRKASSSSHSSMDVASLPPASASEPDSDGVAIKTTRKPKKKSQRQMVFESEAADVKDIKKPTKRQQHPKHTDLVPPGEKTVKLGDQNAIVKPILKYAIKRLPRDLIFENGFPDNINKMSYGATALINAAKHLESKLGSKVKDVITHIEDSNETTYVKALSSLVTDRIPGHRLTIKKTASNAVASYQLGSGTTCMTRVTTLQAGHSYIFAGEWRTKPTKDGNEEVWTPTDSSKPYHAQPVVDTLRDLLGLLDKDFTNDFKSSLPHDPANPSSNDAEVPKAAVALAATAVHAGLSFWGSGSFKDADFSANRFIDVYNKHIARLDKIAKREKAFHHIFASLLEAAGFASKKSDELDEDDALGMMDLSAYN